MKQVQCPCGGELFVEVSQLAEDDEKLQLRYVGMSCLACGALMATPEFMLEHMGDQHETRGH